MKVAAFFVGLFLMIPLFTGVIDTVWWFYTNHALSSIEWDSFRPVLAYTFAACGFFIWLYVGSL